MLYRPSKEPRTDGTTARAPTSDLLKGARLASHQGPMEPNARALRSSSKRPRAAARKTTLDEADTDLLQTPRMFEGARCVPTETANAPRLVVETPVR